MRFDRPLQPARLLRRYKRFLADVELPDGDVITCHCPNTGAMLGCAEPGSPVWLHRSDKPGRKYAHTWELVRTPQGTLVGIHTGRTNRLVEEAITGGRMDGLVGYATLRREVTVPDAPMRADFLLTGHPSEPDCFVEVKNVTAAVDGDGIAVFPDAVSDRGRRHLEVFAALPARGLRAVTVYCAQRADVVEIQPADAIDARYGRALRHALDCGMEAVGVGANVTPEAIAVERMVPVVCPTPADTPIDV